ncbi:FAD binding domain-containing protein [uncultured Enterovirga sp.]|uniref:FAD binding domain-containing protein n=1 Tax=uncultured Enterovirga sp. TaxID=2026352 RepID=UPI0035CBF6CD
MKAAAFEYVRPAGLKDALAILAEGRGSARPIAGGQSLGPMLNLRLVRPDMLVDIARLHELSRVEDLGQSWLVGAAITHAALEDGTTLVGPGGMISHVARGIAYRAVRNRGTVGGGLAHADSAADWPLAFGALGAIVHVASASGERRVPIASLITGPFETVLRDGELITGVEIPKPSARARWGYYKVCRKVGEFPDASAAVVLDPDRGWGTAILGALSGPPRAIPDVASRMASGGERPSRDVLADAVATAAPELDEVARHLYVGALCRAVAQACHA